jgi:hypothetical protein
MIYEVMTDQDRTADIQVHVERVDRYLKMWYGGENLFYYCYDHFTKHNGVVYLSAIKLIGGKWYFSHEHDGEWAPLDLGLSPERELINTANKLFHKLSNEIDSILID